MAGPSREVSQRDHEPSGAGCAGQENEELEWGRRHVPEEPRPVTSVFRKTELHGAPTASRRNTTRRRSQAKRNLSNPGSAVTIRPLETAMRDLVSSLLDRQDLMEENFLRHVADLQQQLDAHVYRSEQGRPAPTGDREVKR